jgi:hypothetical protein
MTFHLADGNFFVIIHIIELEQSKTMVHVSIGPTCELQSIICLPNCFHRTAVAGLLVLNATFASSAPAGIIVELIEEFELSHTLAVLTIALFVAGYCVGPLLWGKLSVRSQIFL